MSPKSAALFANGKGKLFVNPFPVIMPVKAGDAFAMALYAIAAVGAVGELLFTNFKD